MIEELERIRKALVWITEEHADNQSPLLNMPDEEYCRVIIRRIHGRARGALTTLDTLIAAEEAKPQAASGLIEAVDESKDDPAGDLYAKGYADGFKAKAIAVEQELLATRHPACACPLPYRVMIPEQHHESCPVVMPQPAAPASGVDAEKLTLARKRLDWLVSDSGDNNHRWALDYLLTHIRTTQPDLAALLAKQETVELISATEAALTELWFCAEQLGFNWEDAKRRKRSSVGRAYDRSKAAISTIRQLAGIPQLEGGKES